MPYYLWLNGRRSIFTHITSNSYVRKLITTQYAYYCAFTIVLFFQWDEPVVINQGDIWWGCYPRFWDTMHKNWSRWGGQDWYWEDLSRQSCLVVSGGERLTRPISMRLPIQSNCATNSNSISLIYNLSRMRIYLTIFNLIYPWPLQTDIVTISG